ncbi:MAG: antitoxin family protein [Rhizonema sp. PD38]|nr:antitoxin family protein [Rhizonema sp. PD38]
MQQQNCDAVFENGVLRPIGNLQLTEGECVKLIVQSRLSPTKKHFPKEGLIAHLTENPIKIEDFQPLTRIEANER